MLIAKPHIKKYITMAQAAALLDGLARWALPIAAVASGLQYSLYNGTWFFLFKKYPSFVRVQ